MPSANLPCCTVHLHYGGVIDGTPCMFQLAFAEASPVSLTRIMGSWPLSRYKGGCMGTHGSVPVQTNFITGAASGFIGKLAIDAAPGYFI